MRYSTLQDVIEQDILPALGADGDAYDAEAIAREAFAYRIDTDDDGNERLNTAGFEQVVTVDEFWAIVEKHERAA